MPTIVNTHQAEAWNGYEGHHWAECQDRYDTVNAGMNEPLLAAAAIKESDRVLDIGCGNGQTTRLAARQAWHGHALGIDLSVPMLDRARATAAEEGIGNVTFEQGDAQVHPLPAGGFDVAISRGGIMFFADPVAAFANVRRALRPSGRLAFVCPQNINPDDDVARALAPLRTLMRQHAPVADAATEDAPGPTALADPNRIDEVLTGAGFTDVTTTSITVALVFGRDARDAAEFLFTMGPMRFNLSGADPTAIGHAQDAVTAALHDYEDAGAVRLHSALWLVRAIRPVTVSA
jgi:SAM-dependent methyltransferase